MARQKLSQAEIGKRLQRLRNLEQLRRLSNQRRTHQDELISQLQALVARQKEIITEQDELIATQDIRIAELEAMVFGKKRRPPLGTAVPVRPAAAPAKPRDAASYRRPVPDESAVTATEHYPVSACSYCGGTLTGLTARIRYQEDIPLPELTPGYQPHLVTKRVIARGVCTACGRTSSGQELGGAEVSLGPNVRLLAADLISRLGLSYSQVSGLLLGLYGLAASDGEIANMLWQAHAGWLPAYHRLGDSIRAAPVKHYDETPWNIQELQGGFAWSMSDAGSPDVCFALENSRGARHAHALHGNAGGIFVTDGYAAYRSLPGTQQLCWAHLYRGIRDLAYNDNLPAPQLSYVRAWYAGFAAIYAQLREQLAEPYDKPKRLAAASSLWSQLQQLIRSRPGLEGEPAKLRRLKAQLLRAGQDRLFVCLKADTPCDNNRAERDLRQLVLKRKRSFGSKTEKGATALATILSLCTTTWRRTQKQSNPTGYFTQLAALAG